MCQNTCRRANNSVGHIRCSSKHGVCHTTCSKASRECATLPVAVPKACHKHNWLQSIHGVRITTCSRMSMVCTTLPAEEHHGVCITTCSQMSMVCTTLPAEEHHRVCNTTCTLKPHTTCSKASMACAPTSRRYLRASARSALHPSRRSSRREDDTTRSTTRSTWQANETQKLESISNEKWVTNVKQQYSQNCISLITNNTPRAGTLQVTSSQSCHSPGN